MHRLPYTVLTPRLEPVLEAAMSLVILLGFALSAAALIGALRHNALPALLLVAYLVVPLPAAIAAQHLLTRE